MKQITEDYCNFEIAKLLKEKGFDGKCRMIYREHDKQMIYHTPNPDDLLDFETNKRKLEKHSKKQHCDYALCPTHQMALKWLREVHSIHIIPYFDKIQPSDLPYSFAIYIVDEYTATREIIACFDIDENLYWGKQEQAVEAALKYALENLI